MELNDVQVNFLVKVLSLNKDSRMLLKYCLKYEEEFTLTPLKHGAYWLTTSDDEDGYVLERPSKPVLLEKI